MLAHLAAPLIVWDVRGDRSFLNEIMEDKAKNENEVERATRCRHMTCPDRNNYSLNSVQFFIHTIHATDRQLPR